MSVPFVVLRRFLPQAAEGHPDIFTKEKIMRKRFVGNYVKVAVIAVSLAVASSCALAGTFAAFSATYTWSAESGEAGDVAYRDTVFSLDLFDDGYILPGDSGSAEITGVDFGDMSVAWSFDVSATENGRVIPVVFYVSEDGKIVDGTYYSAHDFSAYGGYLSVGGNYIPAASVSTDPTDITAALGTGKSVCWAWPDSVYTDQNGTVDEVALKDYQAYCAKVCDVSYAYTTETFGEIFDAEGVNFVGYATGVDGDNIIFENTKVSINGDNDLLHVDGSDKKMMYEKFGRFDAITSSGDLDADTVAWLVVVESPTSAGLAGIEAQLTELDAEICGKYRMDDDVLIPDENGDRTLVKLPPVQTGVRASVSVTVSAVVTF